MPSAVARKEEGRDQMRSDSSRKTEGEWLQVILLLCIEWFRQSILLPDDLEGGVRVNTKIAM